MRSTLIIATLSLLTAPVVAQQTTVLFESDGSSTDQFYCSFTNAGENSPPFVDPNDGVPAPSIAVETQYGVQLAGAPYTLNSLIAGQVLHGSLDFKFGLASRLPELAFFGRMSQRQLKV